VGGEGGGGGRIGLEDHGVNSGVGRGRCEARYSERGAGRAGKRGGVGNIGMSEVGGERLGGGKEEWWGGREGAGRGGGVQWGERGYISG